jgi:hypothetical protein
VTVRLNIDVDDLLDSLKALGVRVDKATSEAAGEAGLAVANAAKRKASGRPGPNVITGTHRRSIAMLGPPRHEGVGRWSVRVAPHSPQARRLELGFMNMRDSLGRLYHQPPYPYLRPGLQMAAPHIQEIVTRQWRDAMRGGTS